MVNINEKFGREPDAEGASEVGSKESREAHVIYLGFCGWRKRGGFEVFREQGGYRLPLERRSRHATTEEGFAWGSGGQRPADLARSILWDAIGVEPPPWLWSCFMAEFVAQWPGKAGCSWEMAQVQVLRWTARKLIERGGVLLARALGLTVEELAELVGVRNPVLEVGMRITEIEHGGSDTDARADARADAGVSESGAVTLEGATR